MFGLNKILPTNSDYQFMNIRKKMLYASLFFVTISALLLFFKGLNLGIDFKGGTLIEVSTKNSNISELRGILNPEFKEVSLQEFGDSKTIIIRLQNDTNTESISTVNKVKVLIKDKVSEFRRSEFVGPTNSERLNSDTLSLISFLTLFTVVILSVLLSF